MHNTWTRTRNPGFLVKPDPNPTWSQKALLVMAWSSSKLKKIGPQKPHSYRSLPWASPTRVCTLYDNYLNSVLSTFVTYSLGIIFYLCCRLFFINSSVTFSRMTWGFLSRKCLQLHEPSYQPPFSLLRGTLQRSSKLVSSFWQSLFLTFGTFGLPKKHFYH